MKLTCFILFTLVISALVSAQIASVQASDSISQEQVSQERSEAQLRQLKYNINKINHWLKQANQEKSGLSKALEKHERDINKLSKEIRNSSAKISLIQKDLKQLELKQHENTQALNKHNKFLIKQLKAAYIYGEQPDLKVLLNSQNPQNLALDMHYFAAIKDAENDKIMAITDTLESIRQTEAKILSSKRSLENQQIKLKQQRLDIHKKKQSKSELLEKLKASITSNTEKLERLKTDQKRLENLLQEIESAIANIPLPEDAAPFSKRKQHLPWPVKGKVIVHFGSRILHGKLKLNGIRISTHEDQEVKSVHAGRIVFSNWIRGFGLLIIIDHGNNYMSLYGNNKSLAKETGDWVRANETIAYAQESSQHPESGLYFEIRKNGKPLNPKHWLSK